MPLLIFLYSFLILAILALVFALTTLFFLFRDHIPYVATPDWAIEAFCRNANPKPGMEIVEIGCGDARVLRAIKKRFPSIHAIGIERNWWPYLLARLRSRGHDIKIRLGSYYEADYSHTDIVVGYLIDGVMERTEKVLRAGLRPGSLVYSYSFQFPTWEPIAVFSNPARPHGSKLRAYRV